MLWLQLLKLRDRFGGCWRLSGEQICDFMAPTSATTRQHAVDRLALDNYQHEIRNKFAIQIRSIVIGHELRPGSAAVSS